MLIGGTMSLTLTILTFAAVLFLYLYWGIRMLPGERWQFIASVPVRKRSGGDEWEGVNLTWYGLLSANAYAVAIGVLMAMMGGVGVSCADTAVFVAVMLGLCVPASRLVAMVVEKKAHTFTVGGAVFVGIVAAPWVVTTLNRTLGVMIPPGAALSALAVAYAFGEGLGRLACLSFGCCYGKRITALSPLLKRLFSGSSLRFYGSTKKVTYAGDMEGEPVVPVQAVTAVIYVSCGLAGLVLFLKSRFAAAFVITLVITQGWRFLSETLRDDYRGGGKISVYQLLGAAGIIYGSASFRLLSDDLFLPPDLFAGLAMFNRPLAIVFIQLIWTTIFLYTGRSTVTGATLTFHVQRERI
jgi:Prolipoprotein diacylglyceryl transferase